VANNKKKPVQAADAGYITWAKGDDEKRALAMHQVGEALQNIQPVVRSYGTDIYLNSAPNSVHIRDSFSRRDYDSFRPGEAVPKKAKDLVRACDNAVENNGIVANVMSLMADFTAKGIDIVHPNERIEKFFKTWAKKVGMKRVSERLAYYLYLHGNVIVRRHTAKLKVRDEKNLKRAQADPDIDVTPPPQPMKREVPWRYTFLHPCAVELVAEHMAPFVGPDGFIFGVKVPKDITNVVKNPKTSGEKLMVSRLPEDVRKAIQKGDTLLPLDPDKVSVHWYKRDDWRAWARPMLAPILKDLAMLEKLKLADIAALDGAISCIRVWKLGSLEHGVMPHPNNMLRLARMLTNNIGGGVMDLVWGPDLELTETSTEVHRFLGATKYAPILQAIYSGLGIPQTLTGSETATGFTNNYISLKTLTERLEYGRSVLRDFWEAEIALVQKAMGFRFPAKIVFDNMLTDEASERQILLNMVDRDLLDAETVQEEMGFDPDIISVRQRREARRRKEGQMPAKASPFHSPMVKDDLTKLFAGTGAYSPDQFGVEVGEAKEGDKPPAEKQAEWGKKYAVPKAAPAGSKPKGQPGQGRPKSKKDSTKRKKKVVKPRTKATANFIKNLAVAEDMLTKVSRLVNPVLLKSVGKKTGRELTDQETKDFESLKFHLLCQFQLGEDVTEEKVAAFLQQPMPLPAHVARLLKVTVAQHIEKYGKEPAVEVVRRYQASIFAMYRGEVEDETGHSSDRVS